MILKKTSLFCVLALLSSLHAGTHREKFQETYQFNRGGELILDNTNGNVTIETWDRNEVRVEAEKVVKARSRREAEEIMKRVRIEVDQGSDYLEIRTRYPRKNSGGFWRSLVGDNVQVSVTYRLLVPDDIDLDISTVNGKIGIRQIQGQIKARSTNGSINVYEAKGSVDAKTTNGGIDVELLQFDGSEDMSFRTTNGSIKGYFPENLRANIEAKTTNGSIRTDFPIEVRGNLSKRQLRGKINGGGGRIVLHTTNGSIRILER